MRPIVVTVGPLTTASANAIALSQTPGAAGPLTLNGALVTGGVAILPQPRQVLITTHADETAKTFTITGTDWAGSTISEVVTGVNNTTVASVLSYKTVTSIVVSAATAGALTVGDNTVASSPWVRLDEWAGTYVAIQCTAVGTVNYTLQQTLDDPNSPTNPVAPNLMTWVNSSDSAAVGATGTIQTNYGFAPTWVRVVLNSGSGSVTATFVQGEVTNL